jgi:hypothetical protein
LLLKRKCRTQFIYVDRSCIMCYLSGTNCEQMFYGVWRICVTGMSCKVTHCTCLLYLSVQDFWAGNWIVCCPSLFLLFKSFPVVFYFFPKLQLLLKGKWFDDIMIKEKSILHLQSSKHRTSIDASGKTIAGLTLSWHKESALEDAV